MRKLPFNSKFLLLPVENQVRELDSRLFLATIAASRGLPSIIGPIREIDSHIYSFQGCLYLSKSMLSGRANIFKIMKQLGIVIFALDEEALVHLPPPIYFSRRLDSKSIGYVSHLFAWGSANAELWNNYPNLPSSATIHITGNPRIDLLRPELRSFYGTAVSEIKKMFGEYILINTNFNHVNAIDPTINLFFKESSKNTNYRRGRASKGMTFEYASGLWKHKKAVFADFKKIIPSIEKAFPDHKIIVRPHPIENPQPYKRIAENSRNVIVTNEGNVVPWLLGSKLLIHNGCTTGVEAYVSGVPAVSFMQTKDDIYDKGFYSLPNALSHQCDNFDQLIKTINKIIDGKLCLPNVSQADLLIKRNLASLSNEFASKRMVDVFLNTLNTYNHQNNYFFLKRISAYFRTRRRALKKAKNHSIIKSNKNEEFLRHRYPEISIETILDKINKFSTILHLKKNLKVDFLFDQTFFVG